MDVFKDPLVFVTICTLLGLFVGSFLNVVIHRLPVMMEREWHLEAAAVT
jgi:leader peptidase (prepilin peptidase)/N-methyltransferase